ncbi:hypothetical protein J7E95_39675 [Streptomyces sp. ISL-14]|nr:hypothetical protein [Streptomyces sp. ISL-14]
MRIRSILTAATLTTAILIGGTGTAAAQAQPLPNGRCLVDNLLNNLLNNFNIISDIQDIQSPGQELQPADPCDAIEGVGRLQ